ncbi:hypothetical protein [Zobellia galactanivorans]|uniref:hypothetical protein n=1 Tax=Zobellia galactanivorans (strain DSM 12802 / CCUG 47099 / CIP 106680 / NCIMB 13871 / Dsij) TaxID=63186 RepID=UPI001C06833D|nr:hypothetical protein [Zobellia galactanivorans]MBU3028331.1 hypothetical protein [Zobellia galactanivorans]
MSVVLCFMEKPKQSFRFWKKTMDRGDSPWFSICTIDKKGTPKVILARSRHSENHALMSVVLCFMEKPKRSFRFWKKTMDRGDSPWFSICTIDKKGTPKVILVGSRHSENHALMSVVLCFMEKPKRSFRFWKKTMDRGDSPWFSIYTIDKKGTPKVILAHHS